MNVKLRLIQLFTYGGTYMLYSYSQCIEMLGTDRKIKKAIHNGQLFKIEKGIYSDTKYVSELAVISMKYPNAIFTLNSAFYYHALSKLTISVFAIPNDIIMSNNIIYGGNCYESVLWIKHHCHPRRR